MKKFKKNQLVVSNVTMAISHGNFRTGEVLLYLGEIQQMPGHCIVVNNEGKVFWGYHTDNFREPTEEEL
jgi:hypothetical protein